MDVLTVTFLLFLERKQMPRAVDTKFQFNLHALIRINLGFTILASFHL